MSKVAYFKKAKFDFLGFEKVKPGNPDTKNRKCPASSK